MAGCVSDGEDESVEVTRSRPSWSEGDEVKHAKQRRVQYLKLGLVALAFLLLIIPQEVRAQGCAMCYQSAASSGARLIHALKSGIVILIIPPLVMTGAFARLVYRRRNLFNEEFAEDRKD
jgi:hypothetical protein